MSNDYDDKTIEIVNQIFKDLFRIKPAFKQAFPSQDDLLSTKRHWLAAFKDSRIHSIEMIKNGMKEIRKSPSPFFPSPGEFIKLCSINPSDYGTPTIEKAYTEACYYSHPSSGKKNWSHPCIKHAWSLVGSWELQQQSKSITFPLFEKFYQEGLSLFANGQLKDLLEDKTHDVQKIKEESLKRQKVSENFNDVLGRDSAMDKIKSMIG